MTITAIVFGAISISFIVLGLLGTLAEALLFQKIDEYNNGVGAFFTVVGAVGLWLSLTL